MSSPGRNESIEVLAETENILICICQSIVVDKITESDPIITEKLRFLDDFALMLKYFLH